MFGMSPKKHTNKKDKKKAPNGAIVVAPNAEALLLSTEKTPPEPLAETPQTAEAEPPKWLTRTLTVLAYGIPLAFLAYVLYINYLPFGYNKTFTIDVGAEGDTDSRNAFYLEPSPDLSERKTAEDGTTYRELNGITYAVFKPPVVLKDAEITVEVEGDGVSIIPPVIDFNPDEYEWDYAWDFTQKDTAFTPKVSDRARAEWPLGKVPDLMGNAFWFEDKLTFNGTDTRLELPSSQSKFQSHAFSVFTEWIPFDFSNRSQQIVGHYNWELYQDTNNIRFVVGRMNDRNGDFYNINFPLTESDLNKTQKIIAIYSPGENGYIELYVNDKLAGKQSLGTNVIFTDYGGDIHNLTFGKSAHGSANHFAGSINDIRIKESPITTFKRKNPFVYETDRLVLPVETRTLEPLNTVQLTIKMKRPLW